MRCEDYRELMSERVDDCLDAAGARRLEEHLAACAACRRELAELQETVAALRSLPAAAAPPAMAERVRIRLAGRRGSFTEFVNLPQTRLAFAAGLVIILTVWGVRYTTPPVDREASDGVAPLATRRAPAPVAAAPSASAPAAVVPPPEAAPVSGVAAKQPKPLPLEGDVRRKAAGKSPATQERGEDALFKLAKKRDMPVEENRARQMEVRPSASASPVPADKSKESDTFADAAAPFTSGGARPVSSPLPADLKNAALPEPVDARQALAETKKQEVRAAGEGRIWRGKAEAVKPGLDFAEAPSRSLEQGPGAVQRVDGLAATKDEAESGAREDRSQTLGKRGKGGAGREAVGGGWGSYDGGFVSRTTNSVTLRVRNFGDALAQIRQASVRVIEPGARENGIVFKARSRAAADEVESLGTKSQVVVVADIDAASYDDLLARLTAEREPSRNPASNLNVSGRMSQVAAQNAALEQQAAPGRRYLVRFTLVPFKDPVASK